MLARMQCAVRADVPSCVSAVYTNPKVGLEATIAAVFIGIVPIVLEVRKVSLFHTTVSHWPFAALELCQDFCEPALCSPVWKENNSERFSGCFRDQEWT